MKNVYEEYVHLWPEAYKKLLKPLLSTVDVLFFPDEIGMINQVTKPAETIVIMKKGGVKEMMTLFGLGFHHCIQPDRSDFPQELLASAMMTVRPQAFHKDPLPFFLNGFSGSSLSEDDKKNSLVMKIAKNSDKVDKLTELSDFLNSNSKTANVQDMIIQVADEMVSNALFSAPRHTNGFALYQDTDRKTDVTMKAGKEVTLFSCFTADRVVIGCEDKFGSLDRKRVVGHLQFVFNNPMVRPNEVRAGAGLGIKFMIENSANFYIFTQKGVRTMVVCGFLLKGLKANLMADRHVHLSVI